MIWTPQIPIRTIQVKNPTQQHQGVLLFDAPTTIPMPQIGFGTYKFQKGSLDAFHAVLEALNCGYRHIDTAFVYGGEETEIQVGKAIQASNIPREELFITTKQWRTYHGYEPTFQCLELSLQKLQLDYVDLYLIHWPGGPIKKEKEQIDKNIDLVKLRSETWRAMEDALLQKKVKSIGVSNFTIQHLKKLKETARIWPPAVNQIELHPYNYKYQRELIEYCNQEGIIIEAYASLGGQDCGKKSWNALGGKLLERPEVSSIAVKYGRTEAQVLLRWAMQHGFVVIPKSSNVEHMRLNLESALDCRWMDSQQQQQQQQQHCGLTNTEMFCLDELLSPPFVDDMSACTNSDAAVAVAARLTWMRDPCRMLDFD
jgi:diketogulonate reductase-like aldo/keto reductase